MFFQFFGWKIDSAFPEETKKCVIIVAPHTSNWDFIIGRLAFNIYGLKVKFLIKDDLFVGPLGSILKALGGLPVDRSKKNNLTDIIAEMYDGKEQLTIMFTPEGTRSYNPDWKKGFYYIAEKANVPLVLSYIDYTNRKGGFIGVFNPTGNAEKDIETIKKKYHGIEGKVPENSVY